jgi:crotonobetainyl-CoA:carnitine CoA-transferase CaiB-like acyl-CoA transferase
LYETKAGWLGVCCRDVAAARVFLRLLGVEAPAALTKLVNGEPAPAGADLAAALEASMLTRTAHEWLVTLREARVPVEIVNEAPVDLIMHEPDALKSGMIAEYAHPIYGLLRVVGNQIRFSNAHSEATAPVSGLPPPMLGEHTREILGEIGYSLAEIEDMERAGVLHTAKIKQTDH